MNHLFVINPMAGKGKSVAYAEFIKKYFLDSDDPYYIEFTKCPGDATEIVRKYVEADDYRVYSIGGDGTLNEVLNGMAGSSSSLAVIAAGSGNDFFRYMDEAPDETLLCRTINGEEQYVDLGKVNERYFLNVASAGIDAEVSYNSVRFKNVPMLTPLASYVAAVFYTVFRYKSIHSVVRFDDRILNKETLMLAVANGKYYGGGVKIAPSADITDGYLDIYHVDKMNPFRIIMLFPKLIKGEHEKFREVTYSRSTKVNISSREEFMLNIDGEALKAKEAVFEIIPKGIKLVVPLKQVPL
ncbi:MAG: diacylglycerol kinase family protein [Clostridiaceae bacterium]